jgi:hypothetical protein
MQLLQRSTEEMGDGFVYCDEEIGETWLIAQRVPERLKQSLRFIRDI